MGCFSLNMVRRSPNIFSFGGLEDRSGSSTSSACDQVAVDQTSLSVGKALQLRAKRMPMCRPEASLRLPSDVKQAAAPVLQQPVLEDAAACRAARVAMDMNG